MDIQKKKEILLSKGILDVSKEDLEKMTEKEIDEMLSIQNEIENRTKEINNNIEDLIIAEFKETGRVNDIYLGILAQKYNITNWQFTDSNQVQEQLLSLRLFNTLKRGAHDEFKLENKKEIMNYIEENVTIKYKRNLFNILEEYATKYRSLFLVPTINFTDIINLNENLINLLLIIAEIYNIKIEEGKSVISRIGYLNNINSEDDLQYLQYIYISKCKTDILTHLFHSFNELSPMGILYKNKFGSPESSDVHYMKMRNNGIVISKAKFIFGNIDNNIEQRIHELAKEYNKGEI